MPVLCIAGIIKCEQHLCLKKCCNVYSILTYFLSVFFFFKFITALMFSTTVLSNCKHFGCLEMGRGVPVLEVYIYIFFPLCWSLYTAMRMGDFIFWCLLGLRWQGLVVIEVPAGCCCQCCGGLL